MSRLQAIARLLVPGGLLTVGMLVTSTTALAAEAAHGQLFYNGTVVGTVVVPASVPAETGTDPFYAVTNGASGQLGIAGVAPGADGYHGGNWEFFAVTFNAAVSPYLLTSSQAVQTAAAKGDVTVTRVPTKDFRCPVTAP